MRLTSLRVRNYGCLADFELSDIGPLAIFVGANGSGKSTLFDVFAFLRDALRDDVGKAVAKRGGFEALRTREADGPIGITVQTGRDSPDWDPKAVETEATYAISVDSDLNGLRIVSERVAICVARDGVKQIVTLLDAGADADDERSRREHLRLARPDTITDAALHAGCLSEAAAPQALEAVERLRAFLAAPYFSNVEPSLARQPCAAAVDHRLSESGGNLASVVLQQTQTDDGTFNDALRLVQRATPRLDGIQACEMPDGRVTLEFIERGHESGMPAANVSDGTIKLLAYALLLNESQRRPMLCIEHPERHVYPSLMWELLEEIRAYTDRRDAQVLLTTHAPGMLDAADPEDVFWLVRQDGGSKARRVADDPRLVAEHDYGGQLGFMWRTGSFLDAHPA